jgi:hypothetical protein
MNFVTPKVGAKHELLLNKPASYLKLVSARRPTVLTLPRQLDFPGLKKLPRMLKRLTRILRREPTRVKHLSGAPL